MIANAQKVRFRRVANVISGGGKSLSSHLIDHLTYNIPFATERIDSRVSTLCVYLGNADN